MTVELPPVPEQMGDLPRDRRGYPIPWVQQINDQGEPDFRVINSVRRHLCWVAHLCGICGGRLDYWIAFVGGPMGAYNRVSSEPPFHLDCALFATQACPMLHYGISYLTDEKIRERSESYEGELRVAPEVTRSGLGVVLVSLARSYKIKHHFAGPMLHYPQPKRVICTRDDSGRITGDIPWATVVELAKAAGLPA